MPGKASMVLCRDADVNQFEEDDGATPVICLKEQGEVRIIIIFFKTKLLLSELFTFFYIWHVECFSEVVMTIKL